MGKPSIFSKDYQKKMKRRKKLIIIIPTLLIVVLIIGVCFKSEATSNLKNKLISLFNKPKTEQLDKTKNNENIKKNNEIENKKVVKKEEDKFYEIILPSGKVVKADYKEDNGAIKYEFVAPLENGTTFDISPSQNLLLINGGITQELNVYGSDGKPKSLTLKSYTTRDGRTFPRESILSSSEGYKWCENAKFLSEDKIVYLSNLPWFGKSDLETYVWMLDLKTGNHVALMNVKGKEIKFGKLDSKGLQINIDGINKYLTLQGEVID